MYKISQTKEQDAATQDSVRINVILLFYFITTITYTNTLTELLNTERP